VHPLYLTKLYTHTQATKEGSSPSPDLWNSVRYGGSTVLLKIYIQILELKLKLVM